ncbi:MAG: HD domain-containing protein, partial [[Eubacterium] sulci]|nr:HD domain-containing protein [[Eubacterium] sulci]
HTLRVIDNTPSKLDLRLAALFHDISKPICFEIRSDGEGHFYGHASKSAEMAENILRRLKYDNVTITDVCQLVKYHDHQIENSDKIIKRMLRRLGDEDFFNLLDLKRADNYGQSEEFRYRQDILQELERSARRILEENACFSLKDMAIKGSDLIKLGMAQGPEIGEVLEMLLDKVISGEIKNDRQELIACLKDTGAIE